MWSQTSNSAAADVILLGALGLPDVVHNDGTEVGPDLQFRLRFDLDLYAGVRPVHRYSASPGPLATPDPFAFTTFKNSSWNILPFASFSPCGLVPSRLGNAGLSRTLR